MYQRSDYQTIKQRLEEPRRFIQVLTGPRQVGKSTVVKQVLQDLSIPYQFFNADNIPAISNSWISDCWASVRSLKKAENIPAIALIIDEIQKIPSWSEALKKEWDQDSFNSEDIRVLVLGSSRVMLEKGLSDSLAGRFEQIRMGHWSYDEMHQAFGLTLDEYIYFGGYPGSASLIGDEERFRQYIQSSIIDATINKDVLIDSPVSKPSLLRQTFELGASYSGNLLSLNKMIGSLQDAGNTTTLSNYIGLLDESGLLCGLKKFSIDPARRKASIPKFQVYNNALKMVYSPLSFKGIIQDRKTWGHTFESSIGSHLVNICFKKGYELNYWRERADEVDFILKGRSGTIAIEVKSNAEKNTAGLQKFNTLFHPNHSIIVGDGGIRAEDFLSMNIEGLM